MEFDRETKRHFLIAFLISLAFFVESCICDGHTRAVSQSYTNRSRQINVNWNRGGYGVGLFGGILYLRQWYDRRASVILYFYGGREVVIASAVLSQWYTEELRSSCELALGTVFVAEAVSAHSEALIHWRCFWKLWSKYRNPKILSFYFGKITVSTWAGDIMMK